MSASLRVVAMYRVSTEKQATEGASLDAQQRQYRELAARDGWETVAEFRGSESASQATSDRGVLQQVLACIRDREPNALYVHEQSRLTRGDELEVALLLRELRERRVKVIVGGVIRDLSSIDERFMVGIQGLVDRAEAERIMERLNRGKKERARQGRKACAGCPYGYRNPPPGDPQRGILQVVPDQAAVVKKIFKWIRDGVTDREVVNRLNADGVPPPRSGARYWSRTTVRRMLANPVYIGTQVSGAWSSRTDPSTWRNAANTRRFRLDGDGVIAVENAHEAILSRADWDAVQARPRLPRTTRPNLLTGLLWVNARRYAGDSDCRRQRFYVPHRSRQVANGKIVRRRGDLEHPDESIQLRARAGCWLSVATTDEAVWQAFLQLATDPQTVASMLRHSQAEPGQSAEEVNNEIRRQELLIDRLMTRLDRLIEMRADGEIDKTTFANKSQEARKRVAAAEAEVDRLKLQLGVGDSTRAQRIVQAVQTVVGSQSKGPSKLDIVQRRLMLCSIVERIDVRADAIEEFRQNRKQGGGQFQRGTNGSKWRIRDVTFHLTMPGDRRPEADCRVGQLDQKWSSWAARFRQDRPRPRRDGRRDR